MPMTDEQLKTFKDKNGHGVLLFPTVLGAVVPVYSVPNVSEELNFPRTVLADIFLGKITTWNDPAIAKANPKVKLPSDKIVVVHRSDGSGTSFCFTDFLSKVSPDWVSKVGKPNTSRRMANRSGREGQRWHRRSDQTSKLAPSAMSN